MAYAPVSKLLPALSARYPFTQLHRDADEGHATGVFSGQQFKTATLYLRKKLFGDLVQYLLITIKLRLNIENKYGSTESMLINKTKAVLSKNLPLL